MNIIEQRLSDLREVMRREHLDAFIFPSTDPHNSEYTPERWKGREWISGFSGSAGTAVVTREAAALWTDSRYFISAEEQLRDSGFQLMKLKVRGTPGIAEWIGQRLDAENGTEVGIDGMVASEAVVEALIRELRHNGGLTLRTNFDPLRQIWKDRPGIPEEQVYIQLEEYAGEPATAKIERIRRALRTLRADGILVSALDDIAWTLNLRGKDVRCNPVFVSFLLISSKEVTLFVNEQKLTPEVKNYLSRQGVRTAAYEDVTKGLRDYFEYNILLDPNKTAYTLAKQVRTQEVIRRESPIPGMKAIKNDTEISGFRSAMIKDGVALVRFLKWLKPAVEAGGETELTVDRKLTALRAAQPLFKDISFDTIAGYGAHGAIVHYTATQKTAARLEPHGFLLLDSGAQYRDGTTDITRTIALGPVSDFEKHVYTLVLKGHIQLELCKFPDGTTGTQLDILARQAMWNEGMNYMHGTGHGVGSFLNVHERPHQIRMEWVPTPFRAGMVVTNEPGIYMEGQFGVRIENVLLVTPYKETDFGSFLQFEPLTLCPIDTSPVIKEELTAEEIAWLNNYHRTVLNTLRPHLESDEEEWLRKATRPI